MVLHYPISSYKFLLIVNITLQLAEGMPLYIFPSCAGDRRRLALNAEKEIDRKLRNDLKERREKGENVMKKKGEIMRKPRTCTPGDYMEKSREEMNESNISSYRGRGG